jgi:hypothetical protein
MPVLAAKAAADNYELQTVLFAFRSFELIGMSTHSWKQEMTSRLSEKSERIG